MYPTEEAGIHVFNAGSIVPPALELLRSVGVVATVAAGVDVSIAAGAVTTAVCVAAAVCVVISAITAGAAVAVGVAAADYVAGGFAAAEERVGAAGLSGIGSVGCGHLFFPEYVHGEVTAAV